MKNYFIYGRVFLGALLLAAWMRVYGGDHLVKESEKTLIASDGKAFSPVVI